MWTALLCAFNLIIHFHALVSKTASATVHVTSLQRHFAFVVQLQHQRYQHNYFVWHNGKSIIQRTTHHHGESVLLRPSLMARGHVKCSHHSMLSKQYQSTRLYTNPSSSLSDTTDQNVNYNSTTIANQTFRVPTSEHLETIQERQLQHPLQPSQVFCISTNLCRYGHPQAFGFHPTNGPKLVSGLFRLSCPLLCQAIDEYEGEGGVRQMSDWLRSKEIRDGRESNNKHGSWKREGYERANEAQKNIRMELAKDDTDRIISRMGEYNAQKFLESGVAGIPPSQTYNVKCVHAHVADHLCRCSSSSTADATTMSNGEGNIIGEHALEILEKRGVPIMGNDVCWQQCNSNGEQKLSSDWAYVPKKNRQGLRSTRKRRKEQSQRD